MAGVPGTLMRVHRDILSWLDVNGDVEDNYGNAVFRLHIKLQEEDSFPGAPENLRSILNTLEKNQYLTYEMFSVTKIKKISRTEKPIPPYSKNAVANRKYGKKYDALEARINVIEEILRKDLGVDF